MRTKYDQNKFAIYKGNIYSAYIKEGYIRLRSYDIKDVEENGFEKYVRNTSSLDLKGVKDVSPYEVTEYFEQRFKAFYKNIPVSIVIGDDDNVEIEANNISWEILKKAGFNVKNKGEFRKIVKTNELTEFHSIKEDLLEEAKQDFDEINKSKK